MERKGTLCDLNVTDNLLFLIFLDARIRSNDWHYNQTASPRPTTIQVQPGTSIKLQNNSTRPGHN
jgi:hypothetical protein